MHIASASADGTARIWRVSDGAPLHVLTGHSIFETNEDDVVINAVRAVDFSPDGALLVTAGDDGTARLWRVADGQPVRVLPGGGGVAARFTTDGKALFTLDNGTIKFWRVSTGQLLAAYPGTGAGTLAVSPDGRHFAYGAGGALVLARAPLWIEDIQHSGGQVVLRWAGGSGRYQLQCTANLATGSWADVGGPTTATAATNAVTGTTFYRVQSLPNP
jgi:hypothetical protein